MLDGVTMGSVLGTIRSVMEMVALTVSDGRNLLPSAVQNSDKFFCGSTSAVTNGKGGSCPLRLPCKNLGSIVG